MSVALPTPGSLRCPVCALPLEGQAHRWWAAYRVADDGAVYQGVRFECVAQVVESEEVSE